MEFVNGPTVCCPECGSSDIRERNVASALLPVVSWLVEDGEVVPDHYDTNQTVAWEMEDTIYLYVCHACRWQGATSGLVVKEAEEPTKPRCSATHIFNGQDYQCEEEAGHMSEHGHTYKGGEWLTFRRNR